MELIARALRVRRLSTRSGGSVRPGQGGFWLGSRRERLKGRGRGWSQGDSSPFIIKKRVMLKATYSEEDKCWYLVSQKRLVSTSRVGESEAISYVLLCVRAERSC